MTSKHCNRKIVKVNAVHSTEAPWGDIYSLYKDSTCNYYIDYEDGSDNVQYIGTFANTFAAIQEAEEHWKEIFNQEPTI